MAYVTCLVTKNFTLELPGKCETHAEISIFNLDANVIEILWSIHLRTGRNFEIYLKEPFFEKVNANIIMKICI